MKKTLFTITIITAMLVSCNDNKNKEAELAGNDSKPQNTSYETEKLIPVSPWDTTYFTEDDAVQMANQIKKEVTVDQNNNLSIKSFTAYGELQNQVRNLSIHPDVRDEMASQKVRKAFKTFKEEMPAYLKTKMVKKEVDDVEKVMKRHEEVLNDQNATEAKVRKHIARVKDAVEDLNNEIVDVRLSLEKDDSIDFKAYTDFVKNVNFDDSNNVTITDFTDYDQVKVDQNNMNRAKDDEKMSYAAILIDDFSTMVAKMPSYLQIDDVMDAVEDVQEEMREYQESQNDPDNDYEDYLDDMEDIDDALYDFNKELLKARKEFDEERINAIKEYMDDLNQ